MSQKKVIVAGHACLDITPIFPEGLKAEVLTDVLAPGKLVEVKGADMNPGGAVSNTGVAMRMLGMDVSLAAKIGEDEFGGILRGIYAKYGADKGLITCPGERTSYTVAVAVPGIDRVFLHDPGANMTFSAEDIKSCDFEGVSLFHLGYPPLLRQLYLEGGKQTVEVYKYVKSLGVATGLDMVMVDPQSEAAQTDWAAVLQEVLPYVDFFVPSIEELCWFLDRERYNEWLKRAAGKDMCMVIREEDIKPLADTLMSWGAKVVLLKCGAPGLYYRTADEETLAPLEQSLGLDAKDWANREGFEKSFKPSVVRSGTGAGDTTIAAFLTAMLEGEDFATTVALAAAEGACCVEDYGALGGIKTLPELKEKIAAGWEKNDFGF